VSVRVLLYTDSPFFSGAENMIATFLADEEFVAEFDVAFAYRTSPAFEAGVKERVHSSARMAPLDLLDVPDRTAALAGPLRAAGKAAAYLTGAKYRYVRENTGRIEALLRAEQPDVLHINSGGYPGAYSTLAAALAARRAGVPHTIYVANNIAMDYDWRRRLDKPLDREVTAAVELFVTGSSFASKALADVLELPASRLRTIPNGIREREIVEPPDQVRKRVGAPQGRPVVAVVANLERRKGHAVLFAALAELKARSVSHLPWIAVEGMGPEEAALREAAVARGLVGDVAFLGREARVFDLMNAADIVALPSIANEDFPNVVLEAMSLSKPVIASRIAGTPEQIVEGETGLLVPPGDEMALAAALALVSGDSALGTRMGAAGRARFEERFTAVHAVEAYRELYTELGAMGQPRARAIPLGR
jgi:L-malate glycosyltransferase